MRILSVFVLASGLLAGCSAAVPPSANSSVARSTAGPTNGSALTPTPQPSASTGLDFNSRDGNISCAIFDQSAPL